MFLFAINSAICISDGTKYCADLVDFLFIINKEINHGNGGIENINNKKFVCRMFLTKIKVNKIH